MTASAIRIIAIALVVAFGLSLANGSTAAQDWPAFRGAQGNGLAADSAVPASAENIGLKVRWKKTLGSGYSSVVVSDDHVVTMYSDGTNDLIGCFDATNGETLWSTPLGEMYKGENGSFDGPISTPLIHDGNVFCLTPSGKLFCLSLADGSEIWSTDIIESLEAVKPMYGFATSPLIAGGTLILQTGGEEKSLVGIDPANGNTKWSCTTDRIDSQSPALITIEGKDIVLAAGGEFLAGVDPSDGTVLFEHEHGAGNGSAMVPVIFDEDKVLLTTDDTHSIAFSIRKSGDSFQVSEHWQESSIKNTYNVPVTFDGHLYAYSTRILTCVDQNTGQPAWKSRNPGDGFLIIVDGRLIINTKQGGLHIVRATEDGFEELAGEQIFDDLVWSLPAYSKGAVFMRSLGELACVELTDGSDSIVSVENKSPVGPQLAALIEQTTALQGNEAQQAVNAFIASHDSFPVVENGIVEFIYQGDARDVAVASDIFGARQERRMTRLGDTNAFYYAMEMPAAARANYAFLIDFKIQTDPLNPLTMTSSMYAGEMEFAVRLPGEPLLQMSWFAMPDWTEPSFLAAVEKLRGELVTRELPSEAGEEPQQIEVYIPPKKTPPGYGSDNRRYPVLYVLDGENAKKNGRLHELADNLAIAGKLAPIIVFVNGGGGPDFLNAVATEIVPFVDQEFLTIADRDSRICLANGMAAGMGLELLGSHPDIFSGAGVQTPLVFDAGVAMAVEQMNALEQPSRLYLEWGQFDMFNPDENWDVRKTGKQLFDEISTSKNVKVSGGEVADSTDWASWQNRFDRVLKLFEK